MAEEGGSSNLFETVVGGIFTAIGHILGAFFMALPKIISFILWVVVAIIVLPCVFVAGNIYPKWEKWGSEF